MGKANLIYSIFRRATLTGTIDKFRVLPTCWGGDMNLFYGYLCRFNLLVDDRVFLQKRVPAKSIDPVLNPHQPIYPREQRVVYFRNYRRIAAGSGYWLWTAAGLAARSPYDYWYSGRATRDYEDWPLRRRIVRVIGRILARFPSSRV